MTVRELANQLTFFPDDAEIAFEPKELTGIGIPRWLDANVMAEYDGDDKPTGTILVRLYEMDDC